MYHWWKINISLTNGKEINGFVLASKKDYYEMPKTETEYIVSLYERKTVACSPEIYHITCNQVACYCSRYLGIEHSLVGYDNYEH